MNKMAVDELDVVLDATNALLTEYERTTRRAKARR